MQCCKWLQYLLDALPGWRLMPFLSCEAASIIMPLPSELMLLAMLFVPPRRAPLRAAAASRLVRLLSPASARPRAAEPLDLLAPRCRLGAGLPCLRTGQQHNHQRKD